MCKLFYHYALKKVCSFSSNSPFHVAVVAAEVDMEVVVVIDVEIAIGTEAQDLIDISMVEIDLVLTERFGIEHFM